MKRPTLFHLLWLVGKAHIVHLEYRWRRKWRKLFS